MRDAKHMWVLSLGLILALPLGCGSDDDDDDGTPTAGSAGAAGSGASSGAGGTGNTAGGGSAGAAGAAGEGGIGGSATLWEQIQCGWEQLGERVSPTTSESEDPAMLLLDGSPAVGYRQASFETNLHLWDGVSWGSTVADPTGGQTDGYFYRAPDFCYDGQQIVMAYLHSGDATAQDEAFYDRVFAYRYTTAGGWSALDGGDEVSQSLDPIDRIGYSADDPSVACHAGQDPAVAWVETDLAVEQDDDVHVARQIGTAFVEQARIDRLPELGTYALVVDVEMDPSGSMYVAHFELAQDATFTSNLYVTRVDASVTPLGDVIDLDRDTNDLSAPSVVATSESDVYVAYSTDRYDEDRRDVYVAHWDGTEWTELGGGPVTAFPTTHYDSANPDLILVEGTPVLAWEECDEYEGYFIYVAWYDGASWQLLCDRLNVDPMRSAHDPSLAYDPATGVLYAAFEEFIGGGANIFVKRLPLR